MTKKLLVGFGVGGLLIFCSWGARAVLDGAPENATPQGSTDRDARGSALTARIPSNEGGKSTEERVLPSSDGKAIGSLADQPAPKGLVDDIASPVDVLVSLGIVVAVMVGVLFAVSRLMRRARLAPGRHRELDLVDALSLGGKRQVYVVSYKDRTLLLGCGHEDISLLAEYAADEFEDQVEPAAVAERPAAQVVEQIVEQRTAQPVEEEPIETPSIVHKAVAAAEEARAAAAAAPEPAPAVTRRPSVRSQPAKPRSAPGNSNSGGVLLELSAVARRHVQELADRADRDKAQAPSRSRKPAPRPAGAHRVPAAFRHLLDESLAAEQEMSQ